MAQGEINSCYNRENYSTVPILIALVEIHHLNIFVFQTHMRIRASPYGGSATIYPSRVLMEARRYGSLKVVL
ncbi:hypothetical protein AMTR_s00215p00025260 [Amborella trichopoda]|uniref:Uncharacterized protein n=1 Tax=Amborella trichopoda TaxID=13333 RepID=W1NXV6_AMBTC|nr:hypothetical protein AMTR_s00215p00025260 [Amborella trichopoda]